MYWSGKGDRLGGEISIYYIECEHVLDFTPGARAF